MKSPVAFIVGFIFLFSSRLFAYSFMRLAYDRGRWRDIKNGDLESSDVLSSLFEVLRNSSKSLETTLIYFISFSPAFAIYSTSQTRENSIACRNFRETLSWPHFNAHNFNVLGQTQFPPRITRTRLYQLHQAWISFARSTKLSQLIAPAKSANYCHAKR